MKTLHLTLKKKWFDLTLKGVKPFEYRQNKAYWQKRLLNEDGTVKRYGQIRYTNGYGKDKPFVVIKWDGMCYAIDAAPSWGEPARSQDFAIKNGRILDSGNI